MIKQECIGIPDMILLLMIFCFKKIKIKAEIVLSPGGAYFSNSKLEIRLLGDRIAQCTGSGLFCVEDSNPTYDEIFISPNELHEKCFDISLKKMDNTKTT